MGNQHSVAFEEAARRVADLKDKATDEQMLKIYALYKQATIGDNDKPEPTSLMDPKAKMKWRAWNDLKGLPPDEAEKQYIALVEELDKSQSVIKT